MSTGRRIPVVAIGVAVVAYLSCLGFAWAVTDSTSNGFLHLIGRSSPTTAFLGVTYLLSTLVALGLSGAVLFSPPARRWYAAVAGVAALVDLGVTAGIGYRVARADGLSVGVGWYLAAAAVLATCVAVSGSVAQVRR